MATTTPSATDQLAWEAERRPRMAAFAALAGIFTLGGGIYSQVGIYNDYPQIGVLQAVTPALNGQTDARVNPRTQIIQFYDDHAAALIITGIIMGVGLVLMGLVLQFLFRATKARRPQTADIVGYAAFYGALVMGVVTIAHQVLTVINAHDFLAGADRSRDAIDAVQTANGLAVFQYLGIPAQLALAFGFVLVALNAMRAGLLTRFMGVLGIIVGVLFIIPVGPLPVVQCFWLVALAPLFLFRWPSGVPPAWLSGKAEPWPSQQEVREARMRRRGGGGDGTAEPAPADGDDAAEPAPAPAGSGSRKRRKRRR